MEPGNVLTFVNARVGANDANTLRVAGSRIVALDCAPRPGDRVIDLKGDRLLPGLINAHDHLQLNSLPPFPQCRQYTHVHDWIREVDAHRRENPRFGAAAAVERERRVLIGGLKNLLSGVTTVAHHDPLYPALTNANFPVRVVSRYGWSHSLYLEGEAKVQAAHRETPGDWPWIIHAAEGTDLPAQEEFERLDALGCLTANTLIVHGVALDRAQRLRLAEAGAGLIWCPSSNLRLFGKTAEVGDLITRRCLALGTDSRLSGARDLLEELRIARAVTGMEPSTLESLVTDRAARLLRLEEVGALRVGASADLLVLAAHEPLTQANRADVRLVVLNGAVRYGDEDYVCAAGGRVDSTTWARVRVDGCLKLLDGAIARSVANAGLQETGLEFEAAAWRAA